ncbi:t90 [Tupaiid betaherpesvirus 1]|uniref:T90 n=1 Tax=Tupaiid herpesvirus 1 (strain 1) TaxID=10397 RepID=Q997C4_TUHV1|nr:t90 [Tupaiid betaherpesvirus 1]AAK00706.1 T90 protein [Tupaiid betaherpesvirus 1]AAK57133.1 t90 [Tupaiid betaherpesvirus 1]
MFASPSSQVNGLYRLRISQLEACRHGVRGGWVAGAGGIETSCLPVRRSRMSENMAAAALAANRSISIGHFAASRSPPGAAASTRSSAPGGGDGASRAAPPRPASGAPAPPPSGVAINAVTSCRHSMASWSNNEPADSSCRSSDSPAGNKNEKLRTTLSAYAKISSALSYAIPARFNSCNRLFIPSETAATATSERGALGKDDRASRSDVDPFDGVS